MLKHFYYELKKVNFSIIISTQARIQIIGELIYIVIL